MNESIPSLVASVRLFNDKTTRPTRLLAFAELTIAGCFVIKGIRILKRFDDTTKDKPFVVFPAERRPGAQSDRWYDVAHPSTTEARAAALYVILAAYDAGLKYGTKVRP